MRQVLIEAGIAGGRAPLSEHCTNPVHALCIDAPAQDRDLEPIESIQDPRPRSAALRRRRIGTSSPLAEEAPRCRLARPRRSTFRRGRGTSAPLSHLYASRTALASRGPLVERGTPRRRAIAGPSGVDDAAARSQRRSPPAAARASGGRRAPVVQHPLAARPDAAPATCTAVRVGDAGGLRGAGDAPAV